MRKLFMVSLCHQGLLGGWITCDAQGMVYHTGKVTVEKKYRYLSMPYEEMDSFAGGRVFVFPAVTICMKNGEVYKFVVFAPKAFMAVLSAHGVRE